MRSWSTAEFPIPGCFKLKLWAEADGADDMDLFTAVQKFDAPRLPGRWRSDIGLVQLQATPPFCQRHYLLRQM